VVDSESFSVFRLDHRFQKSGHLWYRPFWDCAILYCTVLYCTVLYCTVLVLYLYCTVLYLYCTVLYLYCTVLYCTVLYCTVLYLYCTLLYCTVAQSVKIFLALYGVRGFVTCSEDPGPLLYPSQLNPVQILASYLF